MNSLRIEKLANGFYRIFDYASKMSGLYNADGSHHSGDLRIDWYTVMTLIKNIK